MNTKLKLVSALLLVSTINYQLSTAYAQGTAFTYQGRLNDGANPANGNYDMQFYLRPATNGNLAIGTTNVLAPIPVSNGLFTVLLDFGSSPFAGGPRWLEIGVRTNGSVAPYVTLGPRQQLTPTPYAIFAANASNVVSGSVVQSLNGLKDNVTLAAGTNVTITPSGNTLTIASAGVGGSGIWSVNGNNTYYNAGNVGIGTAAPSGKLTVATADDTTPSSVTAFDTRHALVGTPSSGLALSYSPTLGAGYITSLSPGVSWRDLVLQANGLSFRPLGGSPALTISNNYSVAMGYLTIASGQYSTALGGGSTASGQSSFAAGASAHANADFSVAMGYITTASGLYSTVSGGANNTASGSYGAAGGGQGNSAGDVYATIGGGYQNVAGGYSAVAGGYRNHAEGGSAAILGGNNNSACGDVSVVCGGLSNSACTFGSFVGGGQNNLIYNDQDFPASFGTIAGGQNNTIQVNGAYGVIGGGSQNTAGNHGTVPGGEFNSATAPGSFAAGRNAHAGYDGSFVWSDGASLSDNGGAQFDVGASGGANFKLGSASMNVTAGGSGVGSPGLRVNNQNSAGIAIYSTTSSSDANFVLANNGSGSLIKAFSSVNGGCCSIFEVLHNGDVNIIGTTSTKVLAITSDRNQKENFASISAQDTLAKVAALPISRWNFKGDSAIPHIGPMAQDFYAAFGVGADDKHIATVDEEGVALAAIQGLNQKLEEQVKANQAKAAEIQELKQRLDRLEKLVPTSANEH